MLRAGEDEPDPAPRAAAALVHASRPYDDFWRYFTIWCSISRTILCDERYMVASNILYFRVPVFGVDDLGGDVCGDYYFIMLLPVV